MGLLLGFQVSYSQYYGYEAHIQGGHGILPRDYLMGIAEGLVSDPCPLGLPTVLTVAQMFPSSWTGFCLLCTASGV